MPEKELLLIMPAYNESESIGPFLDRIRYAGIYEIADVIVINDGSTDGTSMIARNHGARVITHIYNLGYGCALQTGYKFAVRHHYKYVIQIDSDGQHDVCNIEKIYDALRKEDNPPDIVIGSRFLAESQSFKISIIKKITIKFFNFIINSVTRRVISDPTSGLQGLNRRAFLYYSLYNHFEYDYPDANMVIQMLLNKFNICEISAVMHTRKAGKSMHSGLKPFIYMLKMTINILSVILRDKFNKAKK